MGTPLHEIGWVFHRKISEPERVVRHQFMATNLSLGKYYILCPKLGSKRIWLLALSGAANLYHLNSKRRLICKNLF